MGEDWRKENENDKKYSHDLCIKSVGTNWAHYKWGRALWWHWRYHDNSNTFTWFVCVSGPFCAPQWAVLMRRPVLFLHCLSHAPSAASPFRLPGDVAGRQLEEGSLSVGPPLSSCRGRERAGEREKERCSSAHTAPAGRLRRVSSIQDSQSA